MAAAIALLSTAPCSAPDAPHDQVPASSAVASSSSPASSLELDSEPADASSAPSSSSPPLAATSSAAAAAASSAPPAAPAFSKSCSPLTEFAGDILTCFRLYGYALIRATPATLALALSVAALHDQLPEDVAATIIGGLVSQVDLALLAGFEAIAPTWQTTLLSLAQTLGLSSKLAPVLPKLLTAATGQGGQAVHWDAANGPTAPAARYSVILYCSTGANSTAMPRWPLSAFAPNMKSRPSMQQYAEFLSPDWFHSVPVFPGDMMIFSQRTPHFGTSNPSPLPRVALFGILSASASMSQDQFQMYRWRYMEEAYGPRSLAFARALVDDAAQRPLFRFSAPKLLSAYGCLVTHKRWSAYLLASLPDDRQKLCDFARTAQ